MQVNSLLTRYNKKKNTNKQLILLEELFFNEMLQYM